MDFRLWGKSGSPGRHGLSSNWPEQLRVTRRATWPWFYRGRHRAGEFSITVDDIKESLRQNPWRTSLDGKYLIWQGKVHIAGFTGGGPATLSIAPPGGLLTIPTLNEQLAAPPGAVGMYEGPEFIVRSPDDPPGEWSPFEASGKLRDLADEGFVQIGAFRDGEGPEIVR